MRTWARVAATDYPYLAVAEFVSGLVVVLLLALAAEVYVLLPGNHVPPGTTLLVLFLGSWMAVLGLVAAILVPMGLVVRTAIRARRARAVLDAPSALRVDRSTERSYWTHPAIPLGLVAPHTDEHAERGIYEPVAVGPEGDDHFAAISEREGCECVSR